MNKLNYILIIAAILSAFLFGRRLIERRSFDNNRVETKAIVNSIIWDTRQSEYISFSRYVMEYEFVVKGTIQSKLFEFRREEKYKYFDKIPKSGDSISIAYDSHNPSINEPIIETNKLD